MMPIGSSARFSATVRSMAVDALRAPVFADHRWQMTWGERFALEGLLSQLRPALALETGTAQGGSLRRIAAHAGEVHSFDIDPKVAELGAELPNVTFHIGDSAEQLPGILAELADSGRHVDFALVDGDHTSEGVRRDAHALLDSDACRTTVIVFHDAANDAVRDGLDALDLADHPKVKACMLDFVPGYLCRPDHPQYPLATWNGLGLVVLGERNGEVVRDRDHLAVPEVYARARDDIRSDSAPPQPVPATAPSEPSASPGRSRLGPILAAALLGAAAGATGMYFHASGYRPRR
jgi:hypothetical protein